MSFYAQRRGRLLGQLAADLFMVGWIVLWWFAGRATERSVLAVAGPARSTGDAARQLSDQIRQAADQTARVPGLGGRAQEAVRRGRRLAAGPHRSR